MKLYDKQFPSINVNPGINYLFLPSLDSDWLIPYLSKYYAVV